MIYASLFGHIHIATHIAHVIVGVTNNLNQLTQSHFAASSNNHHAFLGQGGHTGTLQSVGTAKIGNQREGNHTYHIQGVIGIPNNVIELPGARGARFNGELIQAHHQNQQPNH